MKPQRSILKFFLLLTMTAVVGIGTSSIATAQSKVCVYAKAGIGYKVEMRLSQLQEKLTNPTSPPFKTIALAWSPGFSLGHQECQNFTSSFFTGQAYNVDIKVIQISKSKGVEATCSSGNPPIITIHGESGQSQWATYVGNFKYDINNNLPLTLFATGRSQKPICDISAD